MTLISIQNSINQKELHQALRASLGWLKQSIAINNNRGSSAHKNIWGKWGSVYPETTGYLIPSLVKASVLLDDQVLFNTATSQVDFLLSLQNGDGSYPQSLENKKPFVFDTAQILLGLLQFNEAQPNPLLFKKNILSHLWLLEQINIEGRFISHTFKEKYSPSYFSRVVWPMLMIEQDQTSFNSTTMAALDFITSKQNENLSFVDWSFDGSLFAFTHTIIYTLRGLWECALLTKNTSLETKVLKTIKHINKRTVEKKRFAGSFNQAWDGDYSFICAAGHAQFALLNLLCYKNYQDKSFLKSIEILLMPLIKVQKRGGPNSGAISSSIPIYGKYQRFKYTNWTQKFFVDALIELISIYK